MFRILIGRQPFIRLSTIRNMIIPTSATFFYLLRQTGYYKSWNDSLSPLPEGDTFEMGLYLASQKELSRELLERRSKELQISRNSVIFQLKKIWFITRDHILEPVFTMIRLIEIIAIFAPILICYPIIYFGRSHKLIHGEVSIIETSGSLIWYHLLRRCLELAGPSFIKLGQWAGSRTDMFSPGLCHELSRLHSNSEPHSLEYSKRKICQSLGNRFEFEEIFDEFRRKPLGVGAIAQVYVGKLSDKFISNVREGQIQTSEYDGRYDHTKWVAVKVIHPNCADKINRDLKIMKFIANAIDILPTMVWLSLPTEVEQFSILMRLQLDLRIEMLNLSRFNSNFRGSIRTKFPRGFPECSSREVLFEEYIHGFPMENFLEIKDELKNTELCRKVSDPFIDAFLKMLITDDFIHADLHPGNVMIQFIKTDKSGTHVTSTEGEQSEVVYQLRKLAREDDSAELIRKIRDALQEYVPRICFIDAGLVTELNKQNRINFIALFNALARFDGYHAGELMIERSRSPETAIDRELFALKVEKLVNKVKKRTFTLGSVSIGDLLDQMLSMVRYHHVRMEGDFVSVVVAILLLEGIGRQLDPELDLFARFVLLFSLILLLSQAYTNYWKISSLPILREFGRQKETSNLFHDASASSMLKIWIGLELRQVMSLSARHMKDLVKADLLSPNY